MIPKSFHIVHYKDISNWSVIQQTEHDFGYSDRYPMLPIGNFLIPKQDRVYIQDEIEYKQLTVKTKGGGVCLRGIKKGKDIGSKQQCIAHAGQFVLSKIDARHGAMGVITSELDGAVVTYDFPLFNIKTDVINPQFLQLITTTDAFMRFAQSCSCGTTNRQRINITQFLNQRIPIPSLEEQNIIVDNYNKKIEDVKLKEDQSQNALLSIDQYLKSKLGLHISKIEVGNTMTFIHFKDISRWDFQFYRTRKQMSSWYKLVEISTLFSNFMVGPMNSSIRCSTSEYPNEIFTYIGMENVEKESGVLLEYNEISGSDVKSQTLRVPKNYIIYGKLRPYLNKYWLNDSDRTNVVCSSEFFVFEVKKEINKLYFLYLIASSFTQEQISDSYSGSRMPRITEEIFKSIKMPVPPLSIQQEIVDYVSSEKARANALKEQAKKLREQAITDFEKQIFA